MNKLRRIAFFGASVTSQSNGNGFFDYMPELFLGYPVSFKRFAYSACHLNDAGFFFFNNVIDWHADICILEWNTTGLGEFSDEKLSLIIHSMIANGITPYFLLLPRVKTNLVSNRRAEEQIYAISTELSLPLLDLRDKVNVTEHLRDNVHTNPVGGRFYAAEIYEWIKNCVIKIDSNKSEKSKNYINEHGANISLITLPEPLNFKKRLTIEFSTESPRLREIAISTTVGPYSPVVKVRIENTDKSKRVSIWDQWCNYQRYMLISLTQYLKIDDLDINETYTLDIEILDQEPDYHLCKDQGIDFTIEKYINVINIHSSNLKIKKLKFDDQLVNYI